MLGYSLSSFVKNNSKKIKTICIFLLISSIVLKIFIETDDLPSGEILLFWDYVFCSIESLPCTLFFVPIMFTYLISGIFVDDIELGNVEMIAIRYEDRFQYLIEKVISLMIISILFYSMMLFFILCIGLIFFLPMKGNYFSDIMVYSSVTGVSPIGLLVNLSLIYIMQLIFIGMFALTISIFTKDRTYIFIGLSSLIIFGRIFYMTSLMRFSPLTQSILSSHYPYITEKYSSKISSYTATFSLLFLLLLSILFFLIQYLRIRKMPLVKKGN